MRNGADKAWICQTAQSPKGQCLHSSKQTVLYAVIPLPIRVTFSPVSANFAMPNLTDLLSSLRHLESQMRPSSRRP